MKITLHCKKAVPFQLSQQEIIDMVDPAIMAEIKKREAQPLLKAYILASEGNAYPEVINEKGQRYGGVIVWTKNAIKQVSEAVKAGITKLFINHTEWRNHGEHGGELAYQEARSGQNRVANAYVAASNLKDYNGKLYNVIVAYFPEVSRAQAPDLEAVSMEVEYEAIEGKNSSTIVDKVLNVFGIALLPRGSEPAFDEARSVGVAMAHYFQDDTTNVQPERPAAEPERKEKMDLRDASFDDLKQELIGRRDAQFWQLFDIDKLKGRPHKLKDGTIQYIGGDRKFQETVLEMEKANREELEQEYKAKIDEMSARIKELEPLATEIKTYKAIPTLEKKLADMKVSPLVAAAVKRKQAQFRPGDDVEADAEKFISEVKEEADFYAKQTGQPVDEGPALGGADQAAPAEEKGVLGVDDA